MTLDIQALINSQTGIRLVSLVGRVFPRKLGYRLADYVAGRIASQKSSPVVRAIRANQWVVRGETLGKTDLDLAVLEMLQNTAHTLFDLYHFASNPKATERLIVLDPITRQLIRRPKFDERGLIIVGVHLSQFDLALQWLCSQGMKPLVLTIPNPRGGREVEFEMRKKTGMNILPVTVTAIRQTVRHLRQGGMALTGIDRPISDPSPRPRFFGRPASLPLHHIFLATQAQVPILVMAIRLKEDGRYHTIVSELIEMDSHPNRKTQALQSAEKVLSVAEGFIREVPQQWSMSLPVWPEVMELPPS